MDLETLASLAFGMAVLAFLWILHMDIRILRKDLSDTCEVLGKNIGDLGNRISRVERMLEGASLKIVSGPASG